jgi:hypothetical protein
MPTVTKVRKERVSDGTHEHIAGVCTTDGTYSSRAQVAASIDAGSAWYSSGGGSTARIRKIAHCPAAACLASPYITTDPDHTTANNLENLPRC